MPQPPSISVNEDERMIPLWSIIAATVSFLLVEYYWWIVAPGQRHHAPPPLGLRIYFNLSFGVSWPRFTSLWSGTSAKMLRGAA